MEVSSILRCHIQHLFEDVAPFIRIKDHRPESDPIGRVDIALDGSLGHPKFGIVAWRIRGEVVEIISCSQIASSIPTTGRIELDPSVIKALSLQGCSGVVAGHV